MKIVAITVKDGVPDYSPGGGIEFYAETYPIPGGNLVGRYHGEVDLPEYTGEYPPTRTSHKVWLNPGEVLVLLGPEAYASVYRAAYPNDGTPANPHALFFLESAKRPYSANGLIDVSKPPVTDAMSYFVAAGYITQTDADRVTRGRPI